VVDYFSGKAFGKAMPNKKMPTVVDRLQQICSENGDTYPHIIQRTMSSKQQLSSDGVRNMMYS